MKSYKNVVEMTKLFVFSFRTQDEETRVEQELAKLALLLQKG